jgi:broad specificity phosphatase PhoE
MVATHFILVRHGETAWNAEGVIQGQSDQPLSDAGRRQAELVAARLGREPWELIYTSDSGRAVETAQIIHAARGGPDPLASPELRERSMGDWEGLTREQVEQRHPQEYIAWARDPGSAPPGGERTEQMAKRVTTFLQALVEHHPGGRLLLVTHAGPIKAIACAALGAPVAGQRIWTANGSISRVKWDGEGLALLGLNDRCHLAGEGER